MTDLPPLTAFPGDAVDLIAEVRFGRAEDVVRFSIATASGAVLEVLQAQVQGDVARAPWVVQTGQTALPIDLTFTASCLGHVLASGTLRVEPPELRAALAWHVDGTAGESEVLFEEVGSPVPEPGELAGDRAPAGVPLVVRSEVGSGGRPIQGGVSATVTLERAAASGGFTPFKQFTSTISSAKGVRAIALRWVAEVEGTLSQRVRAQLVWRAGERDGGAAMSRVVLVTPPADPAPNPADLFVPGPWDVVVATPDVGAGRIDAVRLVKRGGGYDRVLGRGGAVAVPGGLAFHFPEGPAGDYDVQVRIDGKLLPLVSRLPLPAQPAPVTTAAGPPGPAISLPDGVCV